jgi:dolichyl-phosphate-mannose-protein mannosyltransferase
MQKPFMRRPVHLSVYVYALLGLCLGLGVIARLIQLSVIKTPIFDEVYFPVMAKAFLNGQIQYDVHPPLGKLLIAVGIFLFGDTSFGWRIIPALAGILLIGVSAYTAWRYFFKSAIAAIVMAICISLDGAFIVYSRTGLTDGILVLITLIAFCLSLRVTGKTFWVLAIFIGLAASVKWVAVAVILPIAYILWRKRKFAEGLTYMPLAVATYLFVVLFAEIIGRAPNPWTAAMQWHVDTMRYQLNLTATHPWGSKWLTWPLELRPVLFYYQTAVDGHIQVITSLGNPIAWWLSTLAVVMAVCVCVWVAWKKPLSFLLDHPLVPLLIGYFATWLPWSRIHRVVFHYHYLTSYMFALLILTYFLNKLWRRHAKVVMAVLLLIVMGGIYFLPFAIASPLTPKQLKNRIWIQSWLY